VVARAVGRAIIADVHPLERLGLRSVLRQAFSCVSDETDDFAGLARLMEAPAVVAVVDWDLPGFSSPDQIRQLRMLYPATRIIVVCTQCPVTTVLELLACGVHGIIPKTLPAGDVQKAFALVASGLIYIPADICDSALSNNSVVSEKPESRSERLSTRQVEVLRLAAKGGSNKEIARQLAIAEATVKVHLGAAFRNMGVNNRARAVAAFRQRDEERERKIFFEGAAASPTPSLAKLRPGQGLKTRAQ
jgi:DNA-binding NarL/FixJ family response regulator